MKNRIKKYKKIIIILFIILIAISSVSMFIFIVPKTNNVIEKSDGQLRIMTYNLKYASSQDYDIWTNRRDVIVDQILTYKPDSLGVQEADYNWMSDYDGLPKLLEGYSWVGVGRIDGETQGEYASIFYLTDKYDLVDSGTFWISETPDEVSKGWDAVCFRICTYAILKNKATGKIYVHYNTHLDHKGKIAREKGTELLCEKIAKQNYPVVLTGDFNYMEKTANYNKIVATKLCDSKHVAKHSMSNGTMNWFLNINLNFLNPIDFVFASENDFEFIRYQVDNTYRCDDKPVSDHYPVIVDLILK